MGAYDDLFLELLGTPAAPPLETTRPTAAGNFPVETAAGRRDAAAKALTIKRGELESATPEELPALERDIAATAKVSGGQAADLKQVDVGTGSQYDDLFKALLGTEDPDQPPAGERTPSGMQQAYSTRADGSPKGKGFLGELKRPDGKVSTELSIQMDDVIGGKEFPLLVPTLTPSERDHLLSDKPATKEIIGKAVAHAEARVKAGKSPFFGQADEDAELSQAGIAVTGRTQVPKGRAQPAQADIRKSEKAIETQTPARSVMDPAISTTARPAEEQASPVPPVSRVAYDRIAQQFDLMTPEQRQAASARQDTTGTVVRYLIGEDRSGLSTAQERVAGTRLSDRMGRAARAGADETSARAIGISQILAGLPPMGTETATEAPPVPGALRQGWRDYEAGVVGSTGATLAYAGKKAGIDELRDLGDAMDAWATGKMPPNPGFADNLVQGIGSMASFLIPGIGVMKGARALSVLSPTLSKWAGAGAMAGLEAAAEANGVYQGLIRQGKSEQEAMAAADKSFLANLAVIGVTDKLAFFNDLKGIGKRIAAAGVVEGPGQEAPQQMIQNYFTGRPIGEGVPEATAIGAIVGGGAATVQGVAAGEERRDVVPQGRYAGMDQGIAADVARENAMAKLSGGLEIKGQPQQGAISERVEPTLGAAAAPPTAPDGRVEPALAPPEQAPQRPSGGPLEARANPDNAAPAAPIPGIVANPDFTATHHLEDGTPVIATKLDGIWQKGSGESVQASLAIPIKASEPNAVLVMSGVPYDVEIVGPGFDEGTARMDDGQIVPIAQFSKIEPEAKVLLGIATPEEKAKVEGTKPIQGATPKEEKQIAPNTPAVVAPPTPAERPVAGAKAPPSSPPGNKERPSAGPPKDPQGRTIYPAKGVAKTAARKLSKAGQRSKARRHPNLPGKWLVVDAPLSQAQEAANLKGKARLIANARARNAPDPERDSLLAFIRKSGGMDLAEKLDVAGGDNPSQPGNPFLRLFTKNGEKADELVRRAVEAGYMSQVAADDVDGGVARLKEMIQDELRGKKHFSFYLRVSEEEAELKELERAAEAMQLDIPANTTLAQLRTLVESKQKEYAENLELAVAEEGGESNTEAEVGELIALLPEDLAERLAMQNPDATPEEFLEIVLNAVKEQTDAATQGAKTPEDAEPVNSQDAADREEAARAAHRADELDEAAQRSEGEASEREGPAGRGQEAGPEVRQPRGRYLGPSVADIHSLADSKGIKWDDDPAFMAFTKEVTGKEKLDDLTPEERRVLYNRLMKATDTLLSAYTEGLFDGAPVKTARPDDVDAAIDERIPDSVLRGLDRLRDFLERGTLSVEGFRKLDIPSKRVVLASVRAAIKNDQVRRVIVRFAPVDVVDALRAAQLTPQALFDDESVLKDLLAVDGDKPVSSRVDVALGFVRAIARMGAAGRFGDMRGGSGESGAAMGADKGDGHSAIVDIFNTQGSLFQTMGKYDRGTRTIEVDGVHRPVENSKGQPIAQTFDGLLAFWRWFGDSKVVDAEGRPLVVYHGTTTEFTVFLPHATADVYTVDGIEVPRADSWDMGEDRTGLAEGYHYGALSDALAIGVDEALRIREGDAKRLGFEDSPDHKRHVADLRRLAGKTLAHRFENRPSGDGIYFTPETTYSFVRNIGVRSGGNVVPAYLRITNPAYLNASQIEFAGASFNVAKHRERGHDGAIFADKAPSDIVSSGWNGAPQIVVFDGTQIKSALGNDGTFDATDPSIVSEPRPLSAITVKIPVTEAETGREVMMDMPAAQALQEIDGKMKLLTELRQCLLS